MTKASLKALTVSTHVAAVVRSVLDPPYLSGAAASCRGHRVGGLSTSTASTGPSETTADWQVGGQATANPAGLADLLGLICRHTEARRPLVAAEIGFGQR